MFKDRVYETSTSTGTGAFTLAGALTGYRTFTAAFGTTDAYYTIVNRSAPGEWEIGEFTVSGTTLTRNAGKVLSSSAGAGTLVNFSAGTKEVFNAIPASSMAAMDGTSILTTVRSDINQDGPQAANCAGLIPNSNCSANPNWSMPDANWWTWGVGVSRNNPGYSFPSTTTNQALTQTNVKIWSSYTLYQTQVAYDVYQRTWQNCNCGPANCYTNCSNCSNCSNCANCGGRC